MFPNFFLLSYILICFPLFVCAPKANDYDYNDYNDYNIKLANDYDYNDYNNYNIKLGNNYNLLTTLKVLPALPGV